MDAADIRVAVMLGVGVLALAGANVLASRRVWSDPLSTRPQRILQTAVIWLIPGMFLVVRFLLGPRPSSSASDPTVSLPSAAGGLFGVADHSGFVGGDGGGGDET